MQAATLICIVMGLGRVELSLGTKKVGYRLSLDTISQIHQKKSCFPQVFLGIRPTHDRSIEKNRFQKMHETIKLIQYPMLNSDKISKKLINLIIYLLRLHRVYNYDNRKF